eukprot:TRINITY_DN786_c0_g1_i2.p1 TRINITY_DN786_c0_g1~~TRINITY_DN786_c0_g1_i2.p1  ORF type:complete len:375 (-),score=48.63 TRINITY_DN786_c0_g1_i2:86-1210(-)
MIVKAVKQILFFFFTFFICAKPQLIFSNATGTHYEIGRQLGLANKDRILDYMATTNVEDLLVWIQTGEGRDIYSGVFAASNARYPQYINELKGVSDGSGIAFDKILLLNLYEVNLAYKQRAIRPRGSDGTKGCTDIHVKREDLWLLGHNEDMSVEWPDRFCWMTNAQVNEGNSNYSFKAFTYPGTAPGIAFGWNSNRMILTINYLYPLNINPNGVSITFLCRDILSATSIEDVLTKIPPNRGSGVSMNVVSLNEKRSLNIEISSTAFSVYEVKTNFSHVNMYKVLDEQQQIKPTSPHRQARINQFNVPASAQDVLDILGDTEDSEYPIYRRYTELDNDSTVATVLFDLSTENVKIFVDNPKNSEPIYNEPIMDF